MSRSEMSEMYPNSTFGIRVRQFLQDRDRPLYQHTILRENVRSVNLFHVTHMQYECFGRVAAGFIGRMGFLHSVPLELFISDSLLKRRKCLPDVVVP
jgi:hypothetical protein